MFVLSRLSCPRPARLSCPGPARPRFVSVVLSFPGPAWRLLFGFLFWFPFWFLCFLFFFSLSTTCCKDVMRRHGGRLCIHVMSIETGITDTEIHWSEAVPLDNFPKCPLSAAALPKVQERNRCHLLTRAIGGGGMQKPLRSRFRMRAIDDDIQFAAPCCVCNAGQVAPSATA